jgi:hypothetical protein
MYFYKFSLEFYIELQLVRHLKFNNMSLERVLTKTDFIQGQKYTMEWQTKIEHFCQPGLFVTI